ncbi:two component transcriptional regulator [Paenibacillus sp. FSL R7-269]|uniref:response regulator transcription factor n=1 Tax=Paenibacillus sp. FSL R7-269 TaxID=1226755 RepID=UPI0003E20178|nr:response regulator transcription factor [Paenibacillus sp. FSL R7-269]ETT54616.1 two component transcriptional regulator [Paenibacillus sp. FSL R7-269]
MKRTTILIAEDEKEIADLIALHLQKEGYHCIKVPDGRAAVQAIQSQSIDLAILDIMMPELDGYEVTRQVRVKHNLPIIFLSAKTSDFDKITGLVMGADDYMIKPFNPMELLARVNSQLRRSLQFSQPLAVHQAPVLESGGLIISLDRHTVTLYGKAIDLTPKEFDILYLLASHSKQVFSAENIFQQVWGEAYYESGNTVMVHIRTLRRKLGEDQNKDRFIRTIWGVGYTFNE